MRHPLTLLIVAGVAVGIVIACSGSSSISFTNPTSSTSPTATIPIPLPPLECDTRYWDPVHHKERFKIYSMCERESGTVFFVQINADGDLTIHVLPDSNRLMGPGNIGLDNGKDNPPCGPNGCLMLEIPCQTTVTESDALGTCVGFKGIVLTADQIPQPGDKIDFAGPHVLDGNPDHMWDEIHGGVMRITKRLIGASSFRGILRGAPHFSLTNEDDDR